MNEMGAKIRNDNDNNETICILLIVFVSIDVEHDDKEKLRQYVMAMNFFVYHRSF